MAIKKSRLRRIKNLLSLMLLLAMFFGAGLLPLTLAHITPEHSIVQNLPNAQNLLEQGRKFYSYQLDVFKKKTSYKVYNT